MKWIFLLISFLVFNGILKSQEFRFTIYFQDSKGNKDSLVYGYDKQGTAQIDTLFGEENIISKPKNKDLDVRFSNVWNILNFPEYKLDSFQSKRQIIADSCGRWWFPASTIDIYCKNWPIKATWDKSLFNNSCNAGSVFTSINPGGWWDTGSPSDLNRADLNNVGEVTFNANYKDYINTNYAYIDSNKDTISVFWIAIGDSNLLRLDVKAQDLVGDYKVYPNPTNGKLKVVGDMNKVHHINITDLTGRLVLFTNNDLIDLSQTKSGIFIVMIQLNNGGTIKKKIINTR